MFSQEISWISMHFPENYVNNSLKKFSCFSQNLVVADIAIVGKYEVISEDNFLRKDILLQGIP